MTAVGGEGLLSVDAVGRLAGFVRARLDERTENAKAAGGRDLYAFPADEDPAGPDAEPPPLVGSPEMMRHAVDNGPGYTLRVVAADRAIVDQFERSARVYADMADSDGLYAVAARADLCALRFAVAQRAQVDRRHRDFREEYQA